MSEICQKNRIRHNDVRGYSNVDALEGIGMTSSQYERLNGTEYMGRSLQGYLNQVVQIQMWKNINEYQQDLNESTLERKLTALEDCYSH